MAVYSGDANYTTVTSPCGAPDEASVVGPATATIVTSATNPGTLGSPIRDTATVTGEAAPAPLPTGTVSFSLFGPANPTCTGAPIFTSDNRPLGGPPPAPPAVAATSADFTPSAVGTYNWVAVYNGDANYPPVTSPCGAPDEASVVGAADVTIVTSALTPVTLSSPIRDTATVTGAAAPAPVPTGTVTFTLFGPANPTCTGVPIFTSTNPVGGPPPAPPAVQAVSDDFTPTAVGTYNWVATYSGDVNYNAVTSPCGAPDEASVVTPQPVIQVDKTATPPTRTAPGGDFTFNVVVTNTSNEVLTITSLTDDIYGDITTRANSSCNTAIGTVLQPAPGPSNTYSCAFVAPFTGVAGDSQTDVVTVRATNPTGVEVNDDDDAVVSLTPVPVIQVDKTATPPTRTAPGGDFRFDVVVTNTSNEVLTITSLTDDVYGDITTRANSTCTTAIGAVLQPAPGPGNTYSCAFTAPFFGAAGDSQTDVVTVRATNPSGVEVTDDDDAVVSLTPIPVIQVDKTATPPTRTAPGGDFTFDVVVTNTSNEVLTITSLTDDIYGNITTRANSTCNTAIGTVLQPAPGPGNTYSCSFVAPFTGAAGDSQTDVVTVRATNPGGVEVTDDDDAVVSLTPIPVIQVDKTATPPTRTAPGGDFTFDVVVTNTSNEVLTITSLTDDIYGDITTRANSTCDTAIGTVLQPSPGPGNTYSCAFTAPFSGVAGDSQTDVVTVRATNPGGVEVTDDDDAVVSLTPVPVIQVDKTATPPTRTAPGGDFTFDVVVTNTSNEVLTITSLTDDIYGDITTRANSTCDTAIGTVLQPAPGPGNTYSCAFTAPFAGVAGDSQTDVVTVRATNPGGVEVTDDDDAVVTLTPVPAIQVDKTATPPSRTAPGGAFTFDVVVTNNSNEVLTITSLTDDVYGDITTRADSTCDTAIGTVLQPSPGPGNTYSCAFTAPFTGVAGDSQTDVVTVRATNPGGVEVTDDDDAVVTLTPIPVIQVDKTATPPTRTAPGGDFRFDVVVTNTSTEVLTITSLTDDIYGDITTRANSTCTTAIGAVLQPAPGPGNTYSCAFTAPFLGAAGASQTDVVTVRATNPQGVEVTDDDDAVVTLTPAPTIQVDKTATPTTRPAPGGDFTFNVVVTNTSNEVLTITSLTDDVYGNITTRPNSSCGTAIGTVLQPGGTYSCAFTAPFTGASGSSQTDVVTVRATNPAGVEVNDDDDAVVTLTPAPTIQVDKTATPLSLPEPGGDFRFNVVVTNNSTEVLTITSLTDDVYGNITTRAGSTCTTAIGTVLQPGGTYSCSFVAPFTGTAGASQTDVVTVRATNPTGVEVTDNDDATVFITNVVPAIHVDKTATPSTRPEPGGSFTFNVVVTNIGSEPLTITALTDDVYGNLATKGTCTTAIGTVLAPGASYSCSFNGDFFGNAGQSQTDVVTVRGQDDEGTQVTDDDDAVVRLTDVPPSIVVVKEARPTTMAAPGGTFTFDVAVTNTSFEPVTITALTDNIYGNLNGRGTCRIGAVLQPGQTYRCSFPGDFTGPGGASQTDRVTATAADDDNTTVTAFDDATVNLAAVPVVVVKVPPPKVVQLVRTGSDFGGPAFLAIALLVAGTMMVAAAAWYRRPRWAGAQSVLDDDTSWFHRPSPRGGSDDLLGGAGLGGGPPGDSPEPR